MKTAVFRTLALLLGLAVPYLLAEGAYSVAMGPQAETSLGYRLYAQIFATEPAPAFDPRDPTTAMITDVSEVRALLGSFKAHGVGLGNSPFDELKTEEAAINTEVNGCKVQKPNLHKTMSYLRSNLFNPFDQLTYFYDTAHRLPPEIAGFFERYQFRPVRLTTNDHGERLTLPDVRLPTKVLVAGDSVANGVMLDDAETLPSQLQAADHAHQYINLGINAAKASDIVCALEKAAERYRGEVGRVIYVFCENDFDASQPYGAPEELIAWLVAFRQREKIERVTLLYMPYIYNSVPEVTRIRGHSHYAFPTNRDEKRRLLEGAREAGFDVIDFLDVANEERQAVASQFAPLALYVDHTHLSRLGVQRLLPRFAALEAAG